MQKILKSLALGLALTLSANANATTTLVYHNDGSVSAVVTDDASGQTEVYDNNGSGWEWQSWHGEAHDHAEITDRVTGAGESVSDAPEPDYTGPEYDGE